MLIFTKSKLKKCSGYFVIDDILLLESISQKMFQIGQVVDILKNVTFCHL